MAFKNRIRLPFKLHKPQFVEERQDFIFSDGSAKTLSVIIRKVYEGLTDEMPEKLHERLKIALAHDNVSIEGDRYIGSITQEGDYTIEWSDFLSRPIAQAKFKANVTPYNAINSNCGTCEEYTQVVCEDDNIGDVNEDDTLNIDALDNDSICCNPFVLSIVSYNTDYIDAISINVNNTIDLHIKNSVATQNGVILATYRVTCENGMYDEANIIANVTGTAFAECLAPTDLIIEAISDVHCFISWTMPSGALSYEWQLYLITDLINQVDGGTANIVENAIDLMGLTSATQYRFFVNTVCADDNRSTSVYIDFTTDPASGTDSCGEYLLENQDFDNFRSGTYIDCNGATQNINLGPLHNRTICALQNSPGDPVDITVESEIQILYQGLC